MTMKEIKKKQKNDMKKSAAKGIKEALEKMKKD